MQENKKEQKEALQTLLQFNDRLIQNISTLTEELSGTRQEDTDQFLQSTINAINWEVQVLNGTMPLLNEGKTRICKEAFNEKILALGDGIRREDDESVASALLNLVPEFEQLGAAAREVLA